MVSRDDFFFDCLPHTNYAWLALASVSEWMAVHRRGAEGQAGAAGDFLQEWPQPARLSMDRFASALRSAAAAKVSPTTLWPMALQSLWFALNPTIERLLVAQLGGAHASGVQMQIGAAVASYRRVLSALRRHGPAGTRLHVAPSKRKPPPPHRWLARPHTVSRGLMDRLLPFGLPWKKVPQLLLHILPAPCRPGA